MTVDELLQHLETMTHAGRVQVMIDLGRRDDAESAAIITALARGGFYERFLALYSCFGSQNREQVLRALADPSRIIRGPALRLLPIVCDEAQLASVLESAPAEVRLPILWKLRQRKQQAAIDTFLERLAAQNGAQFCQLLPFGSAELVARLEAHFQQQATPGDWRRLARFHPGIALDLLQQWATAITTQDSQLVQRFNSLLPLCAQHAPDRALALVQTLSSTTPLSQLRFQSLIQHRPGEIADLVLKHKGWLSVSFTRVVNRLTVRQILALYAQHEGLLGWYFAWFPHLTPEQRQAVSTAGERRFRYKGALPTALVERLPRAQREQEARRTITLPNRTVTQRLEYAGLLPWEEALAQLEPSLHATETATRQKALEALIQAATYQHAHLGEALTTLRGYRTEHDPVRRVTLQALRKIPLGAWREEHLGDLAEIIRHGLNDVGLSAETQQAITALLLKLLPAHPAWSAAQLVTVLRERGLASSDKGTKTSPLSLSDAQAASLLAALLPVLHTWQEQDKSDEILQAARWFVTSELAFDGVLPLLVDLLERTRSSQTAEAILTLLAKQRFERFETLLPTLLQEDPSWITFASVSSVLLRRRQHVLAPFLRLAPYTGRWSTGRKRFLPPLPKRFTGGTTRQQEAYANALMEIIGDDTQESQALTQAVQTLPLLPAIAPTRLAALANDSRSVVRTTALFALGRLDTNQGLPTLIEALQDARARIAIPALRSFLHKMPPAQALAIIRSIPMNRVTVAKERVRLTGEIVSEEAYRELLALERRKLHRDVRIALVRMLAGYPERAATWPLLEQAAASPNAETALAALPRGISPKHYYEPVQGGTETVEQHLLRLMVLLLNHPDTTVRQGAMHSSWLGVGVRDQQRLVLSRLLELLHAPTSVESQAAARAIVSTVVEADAPVIAAAARDLLPNRRVLLTLITAFQPTAQTRARLLPISCALLATLAADPLTVSQRVRLAFFSLPVEDLIAFFQSLSDGNELHAEALMRACHLVTEQYGLLDWEAFEATFAANADERLRRLAFAALEAQRSKQGTWDEALKKRLATYRADSSRLVASAAAFTLPNDEEDEDDGEDDDYFDDE